MKKIPITKEEDFPDHQPPVPYDPHRDAQKEKLRKQAHDLKAKSGPYDPIIITKNGEEKYASELTVEEQEHEFVRCSTDPIYFIETFLTVFDQTIGDGGEIVPFKLFSDQKKLITAYEENRFVVANKYRQAGISTATCAYLSHNIMFRSNRSVAIVANRLDTAKDELMNDVVDFIESCPVWLRPKTGKEASLDGKYKDTQKLKRYDNGSELAAFSSKGLRGYTPTMLFWDETAWTEKSDKFWTSAKPTLQTGGRGIFVSCVTEDTFIYTNKGIKQIKEYIPNNELGPHIIDEYNVLGIDKLRKGNIFFNNGYVDTLKITTTYTELESSLNHKYWAYSVNDKKYGIFKTNELNVGDYVSIQKGKNVWGDNDDCSDFKPTISLNIKNVFNPTKITKDIAYFIGLYLSEGYMHNVIRNNIIHTTQITITCGDDISHVFDKIGFKYYFDGIHYTINSKNIGEFFEYLGFDLSKKAKEKTIPPRLLEMSRENIIAMIQGIMDGDGWSSYNEKKNKLRVGIGLSSPEFIKQLRILFGNFGILTEYQKVTTPKTKKVNVESIQYRLTTNSGYALKYLQEIGFRFERKQNNINRYDINKVKNFGVADNIPNGCEILFELFKSVKYYGIHTYLSENNQDIQGVVHKKQKKPCSRKTILNFIKLLGDKIPQHLLDKYIGILDDCIVWTRIKKIEKSKNRTYDFSLPNDVVENNDFHHSVVYNQIIGYQTPNGYDETFYPTFDGARKGKNNFAAVELWWFNDPRYNKGLCWFKNKGKDKEIKLEDSGWSPEERIKLQDDGWFAWSPWLENEIRSANGDMRKVNQEILCVFGDSMVTIKDIKTEDQKTIRISDLYDILHKNDVFGNYPIPINKDFEILDSTGDFVPFLGVTKTKKDFGYKVVLENGDEIIVGEEHIFMAGTKNMYVTSLIPKKTYITTLGGDFFIDSIEKIDGGDFYDIIDSFSSGFIANNIANHNCSFLGSGDNFIAEEYLKRIQDDELQVPLRSEYIDMNMWIFEDPLPAEEYIIALDVSSGHGDDNSSANVLKIKEVIENKIVLKNGVEKKVKIRRYKAEQVAEYYGKLTPQQLGEVGYQYGKIYNNAYCIIDITGGYGVQTVEKLIELGYENVHYSEVTHKPSRDMLQGYIKRGQKALPDGSVITVDLIPGFFIGSNRGSVLLEMQRAIHLEDVVIHSHRLYSELKTFLTVQGSRVADHRRTFHDDSIISLAIGLYVMNYEMSRFKQSKTATEKMLNAMITNNDVNERNIVDNNKYKSMFKRDPNPGSVLGQYLQHSWLFTNPKK